MNAMTWVKGVVVAMGLSLTGGAALAANPTPNGAQTAAYGHGHDDRDDTNYGGHDGWDPKDHDNGWGPKDHDNDNYKDAKLYRLGRQKVAEGKDLQEQAMKLTYKARFERGRAKVRLVTQARNLKLRGERLEREGQVLIRRARA